MISSPGVAGPTNRLFPQKIELSEAVQLAAIDTDFYGRFFFPQTIRQKSPPFHALMDAKLEGPSRKVSFMVFRDGAKTTKLRIFLSKRIAYAISRTILIVGKSQDHSRRTVEWLMSKVEYNSLWANTFALRKGKKWTSEEIEIFHGTDDVPIRVIALGITGSTRGINVDDYRPDLIVIDDPCDEENTATPEQRQKTEDLLLGSLNNSLAPASEFPRAKIVLLQTLLHPEDVISKCDADPSWDSVRISVFREDGTSSWPDRYPTKDLLREKEGYIARGKLPLWMRDGALIPLAPFMDHVDQRPFDALTLRIAPFREGRSRELRIPRTGGHLIVRFAYAEGRHRVDAPPGLEVAFEVVGRQAPAIDLR